jgi:hypothetical protein
LVHLPDLDETDNDGLSHIDPLSMNCGAVRAKHFTLRSSILQNAKAMENKIKSVSQQLLSISEELEHLEVRYAIELAEKKRNIESKVDELNPVVRQASQSITSL